MKITCPCCGYRTLVDQYDGCDVCNWELDFAEISAPDSIRGVNGMTLFEGQKIFQAFIASNEAKQGFMRRPQDGDIVDPGWKPLVPLPLSFYVVLPIGSG